jgi:hypothetical protein
MLKGLTGLRECVGDTLEATSRAGVMGGGSGRNLVDLLEA